VLDENSNPIVDASVTIDGNNYTTNASGQISVQLPDGEYNYSVVADGYLNNGGTITVAGANVTESTNMVPETAPVYDVTITVLDENSNPIVGATVTIDGNNYTTNASGQITVQLPDGEYNYSVVADGYLNNGGTITVAGANVTEIANMVPETAPVYDVIITVLDENSNPIVDASVTIEGNNYTTNENGQITVQLPDGNYDYSIDANGYETALGTLTIIDGEVEMSVTLIAIPVEGLVVPQGFSPNGDGVNDHYVIPDLEKFTKVSFEVFNRWGNVVYKQTKYENNWDGTSNVGFAIGKELPTGTYFYVVIIHDIDKTYTGYIYLNR
jgi:gliding motility-associated-like protein